MNLADKPCYPHKANIKGADGFIREIIFSGLTFRERLIIALASNPAMITISSLQNETEKYHYGNNALHIIIQADAIIKEMEKE